MNKYLIEGNWLQIKGKLKESWGLLILDGREVAEGRLDQFRGRIQERRGRWGDDSRARAAKEGLATHGASPSRGLGRGERE